MCVCGWVDGSQVVEVAAGECVTAARTLNGDVFAWGCYKDTEGKQFCHAASPAGCVKAKQSTPTRIEGIAGVTEIAAGECFIAARCESGAVFTWGLNLRGELGRPTRSMKGGNGKYDAQAIYEDLLTPAEPLLPDGR